MCIVCTKTPDMFTNLPSARITLLKPLEAIKNLFFLGNVFRVRLVGVLNLLLLVELEADSRFAFFRLWSDVDGHVVPLRSDCAYHRR